MELVNNAMELVLETSSTMELANNVMELVNNFFELVNKNFRNGACKHFFGACKQCAPRRLCRLRLRFRLRRRRRLRRQLLSVRETPHESLQIGITHFLRHSERRKPRATITTCNDDVPSRPRTSGLERVLERARSLWRGEPP